MWEFNKFLLGDERGGLYENIGRELRGGLYEKGMEVGGLLVEG